MRTFARHWAAAIGMSLLGATAYASAPASGMEYGVNRAGGDYKHVELAAPSAGLCESECNLDPQCKAWTYVNPGVQGPKAVCWLKSIVPAATADNCCTSGVKPVSAGGGGGGTIEPNTNRFGGDYENHALKTSAKPSACRKLCKADDACKAWTYVKAGIQGPKPVCWLKSTVPPATPDACCTSGVK